MSEPTEQRPQPLASDFGPTPLGERIQPIDILRGVALLGILVINMPFYAMPGSFSMYPSVFENTRSLDLAEWWIGQVFFFQKFIAIFSMLFGAGIILMYQRAEEFSRKFASFYYRRVLWLLLFGLIHMFVFWVGDILSIYALCGLILFLFRKLSSKTLIILGVIFHLIGVAVLMGSGFFFEFAQSQADAAEQAASQGESLTMMQIQMRDAWMNAQEYLQPGLETLQREVEIFQSSDYGKMFMYRLPFAIIMLTQGFLFMLLWHTGGLMLIGMGLMKSKVLTGERSTRFYTIMLIVGFVVGFPLVIMGAEHIRNSNFDMILKLQCGGPLNYIGSIFVALGYIGAVMLICKSNILKKIKKALAAVGRMALTNYLLDTLVMTTIFYGYGLGLFGKINRFNLIWFILGMWIVQLVISPLWLKYFRFGPMEWLWRTLTYWKRQPMRLPARNT